MLAWNNSPYWLICHLSASSLHPFLQAYAPLTTKLYLKLLIITTFLLLSCIRCISHYNRRLQIIQSVYEIVLLTDQSLFRLFTSPLVEVRAAVPSAARNLQDSIPGAWERTCPLVPVYSTKAQKQTSGLLNEQAHDRTDQMYLITFKLLIHFIISSINVFITDTFLWQGLSLFG